jgi:hypothetical protein
MQKTEIIDKNKLFELFEFISSESEVQIYESYSEMESEIIRIKNYSEFSNYFKHRVSESVKHLGFGVYYPESKGVVSITKIELDPKRCKGKTYRYRIDGWGIIFIHLNLIESDTKIECRISVNSQKRGENWKSTHPEFGDPESWEWKIVETNARKLINLIKKLHTTADKRHC